MERGGQPWNRCFGRSFHRALRLLLITVILIAPAARAEITDQQIKHYVRNTLAISDLIDDVFSATIGTSYSGIPYKKWIESIVSPINAVPAAGSEAADQSAYPAIV